MNDINTTRLANGVRIISRARPGAHSAAVGVWLHNGGRHQAAAQCGYAHLLEHLFFKGTRQHSALQLAQHFESMGGQVNAHTGRELTALHGVTPGAQLPQLLTLFIDMLLEPGFSADDLDVERDVVYQEMAMVADTPEEALADHGVQRAWPAHAAGWPILGTHEVLAQCDAMELRRYLSDLLCGARLCVVASGAVEHARVVEACARLAALPTGSPPVATPPRFTPGSEQARRDFGQAHLLWLLPVAPVTAPTYPATLLANHLLGGGTASRLFQEIRERRGLAYGIHSRLEQYSDCGLWLIQTACAAARVAECRAAVEEIFADLCQRGPGDAEVAQARAHLHAALLIDEDDVEASMERLAREAIYLHAHPTLDERVRQLAAVTATDLQALLAEAWRERQVVAWLPE